MKHYIVIALVLLLSGTALGECLHGPGNLNRGEPCDCSHRPYQVFGAMLYRQGNTMKIVVADSVGCAVFVSLDGCMGSGPGGKIRFSSWGAKPGEVEVAGPEEEASILGMLSQAVDKYMTRDEQFDRLNGVCPDRLSLEMCRYCGGILEVLYRRGWR